MGYGIKIKQFRLRGGMSVEEAAKRADIAPGTLLGYENEETPIPVTAFLKLSRLYGFDVFDILGVSDNTHAPSEQSLIYDTSPIELFKAHCETVIGKERDTDAAFGNTLPEQYYDNRYEKLLSEIMSDPELRAHFPDIESGV